MVIFPRFLLLSVKGASCPHRKVARQRVLHDPMSQLRLGASAPQKEPEIDTSMGQNFTQATLNMKGDPTIIEPIGAVTSILLFLQRNKSLANDPLRFSIVVTSTTFTRSIMSSMRIFVSRMKMIQFSGPRLKKNRSLTNLDILNNHLSGKLTALFIRSITEN